jgi:hypothetical protein
MAIQNKASCNLLQCIVRYYEEHSVGRICHRGPGAANQTKASEFRSSLRGIRASSVMRSQNSARKRFCLLFVIWNRDGNGLSVHLNAMRCTPGSDH